MSVINTNVKALVSQESMRSNNLKLSSAMERLSTGLRINSAKDDAAGLAISNRMTAQIRGISMAVKNSNDATYRLVALDLTNPDPLQRVRDIRTFDFSVYSNINAVAYNPVDGKMWASHLHVPPSRTQQRVLITDPACTVSADADLS